MNNFLSKSWGLLAATLLSLIIMVNFFSGIGSGIWLIALGKWREIIFGFVIAFIMPYAYTIVALPSMGFAYLLTLLVEKKRKFLTLTIGLISIIYQDGIILIWTFFIFNHFSENISGVIAIPLILWGYSTVTAPLAYMAKNEPPESLGTSLGIFLAQAAYLILTILWVLGVSTNISAMSICLLLIPFSILPLFIIWKGFEEDSQNLVFENETAKAEKLYSGKVVDNVSENKKYCPSCGKEVSSLSNFCKFCGNNLN